MAESVVLKLLENMIPLLLAVIILAAIIYILIRKILSPFSAMGNFLWDKSTKFYNKIAHERKEKLETQIKNLKIESSEWKNKYINNTNFILEIKDKLNDLSKVFSELNEIEIGSVVMDKNREENIKRIDELKSNVPSNIFSKIKTGMTIKRLSRENAKIEKAAGKIERSIDIKKELIKARINELQDSVNNLSDNKL